MVRILEVLIVRLEKLERVGIIVKQLTNLAMLALSGRSDPLLVVVGEGLGRG